MRLNALILIVSLVCAWLCPAQTLVRVNTLNDLQGVHPTGSDPKLIGVVGGGDARGDGSGGVFYYDGSSLLDANGVDVVKPNSVSESGRGRWERVSTPVSPEKGMFWSPPTQPGAKGQGDFSGFGASVNYATTGANYWITNLWEPLRTNDSTYISRSSLGLDQSGQYTLWAYSFTPIQPEKTNIVFTAIHGEEKASALTVYRFFYNLSQNWLQTPELWYARQKVKWIVVPAANPWGTENNTRTNSAGVDLNRNWDYKWAQYTPPNPNFYKGTAPFSEAETQHLRDLISDNPYATAFLDMHDYGPGNPFRDYIAFTTDRELASYETPLEKIIQNFWTDSNSSFISSSSDPIDINWAKAEYGIEGYSLETSPTPTGPGTDYASSEYITWALRWYGNALLQACSSDRLSVNAANGSYDYQLLYTIQGKSHVLYITNVTASGFNALTLQVPIEERSKIKVSGSFCVNNIDSTYGTNQCVVSAYLSVTGNNAYQYAPGDDFTLWESNVSVEPGYDGGQLLTSRKAIPFSPISTVVDPWTNYGSGSGNSTVTIQPLFRVVPLGAGPIITRLCLLVEVVPSPAVRLNVYSGGDAPSSSPTKVFP